LPQTIELGAGTKPYVDVDVLCYVPRMEEAFGYIFFDINFIRITNNYCIFVNFCDDGTGREYPAKFQVDVWADGYDGSEVVIGGEMNNVSGEGNSFAATVLCFPLPPLGEGEMYYARVTVLDAGTYDADASDFVQFTISQADVDAQLLDTPRYEHIIINCDGTPGGGDDCTTNGGDSDGDGICDNNDDCPNTPAGTPVDNNGCPLDDDCTIDSDGDGVVDCEDDCADTPADTDVDENGCPIDDGGDCNDTAFMQGDVRFDQIQGGPNRWGWIENFDIATENGNSYDIYAGASNQYNLNENTRIGDVTITFNDVTNMVTLTFDFDNNSNGFSELHVNVSESIPSKQTLQAPGQYNRNGLGGAIVDGESVSFSYNNPDGDFYIVVHGADACKDGGND